MELEKGVELLIGLEAISDPDERGMRTVMCIMNGQLRPVVVRDRNIASEVPTAEKADRGNPDHVAAPFAGVVSVAVDVGDAIEAGETIATIEAMKMEAAITAPKAGTVGRIAVASTESSWKSRRLLTLETRMQVCRRNSLPGSPRRVVTARRRRPPR